MASSKVTQHQADQDDPSKDLVFFETITRAAKGQLRKLSGEIQQQVFRIFKAGKQSYACTAVQGQSRLDAKHARVTQSVRISYIPHKDQNCVVHIGTHKEFEKFADHFAGVQQDQKVYEIQELLAAHEREQQAAEAKEASDATPSPQPKPAIEPSDHARSFTELFQTMVLGVIDDQVNEHLIKLETKVDNVLHDIERNTGKVASVETLQSRLENKTQQYDADLKTLHEAAEETSKTVQSLSHLQTQRKERINKLQKMIVAVEREHEGHDQLLIELKGDLASHDRRNVFERKKLADKHSELSSRHQQLANTSVELVQRVDQNHLELQTEANYLRDSLSKARERITELETESANQQEHLRRQKHEFESTRQQHADELRQLHSLFDSTNQRIETLHEFQQAEKARREATFGSRIGRFFSGWFGGGEPTLQAGD